MIEADPFPLRSTSAELWSLTCYVPVFLSVAARKNGAAGAALDKTAHSGGRVNRAQIRRPASPVALRDPKIIGGGAVVHQVTMGREPE